MTGFSCEQSKSELMCLLPEAFASTSSLTADTKCIPIGKGNFLSITK